MKPKAADMLVSHLPFRVARRLVTQHHYLHRPPPISFAFGLFDNGEIKGVMTFGVPASRHMMIGACPCEPSKVIELNRLWVHDDQPKNTETWFLAKALALMPPMIVLSYADTASGHQGYVYRAANFFYAGWTDMERKTPRLDYVPHASSADMFGLNRPERHTRESSRTGVAAKVRRHPKVKYWTVTGNRRERRDLMRVCRWPSMSWKVSPPPRAILDTRP